jgi:hypothetical protein
MDDQLTLLSLLLHRPTTKLSGWPELAGLYLKTVIFFIGEIS